MKTRLFFQTSDLDALESFDFDLMDECGDGEDMLKSGDASDLELLCMPYTPLEPELSDSELSKLDALDRLQAMGVLLPDDSLAEHEFVNVKKLSTRMVRTWRDKRIGGRRVWLRRSRYVAREYAWMTPERQDFFFCFLQSHSAAFTYPFLEVGPQRVCTLFS